MTESTGTRAVDGYIAAASIVAQPPLRRLRELIRSGAPQAEETISYGMPYYRYHGRLMYFAAFKNHLGLFPVGNADKHLEMSKYMTGKGTYRFPLDQPLPVALIRRLVKTRVKENEDAARAQDASPRSGSKGRSASRSSTARSRS